MQWLRAFHVALTKGPPRELTEKTPCDDVVLLVAQTLHTAFTRPSAGRPRNVQMALAAVVSLRAALALSPHNAELRLEVCNFSENGCVLLVFCLSQLPAALGSSLRHRRSQPLLTRVPATRRQEHALRHIFVAAHQLGVRLRVLAGHQPSQRLPGDSQINARAIFSSSFLSFSRAPRSSFLPKTMCSIPRTQSLR